MNCNATTQAYNPTIPCHHTLQNLPFTGLNTTLLLIIALTLITTGTILATITHHHQP